MSTIPRKTSRAVYYPDSDGKPMAETPWHRDNLSDLIAIIDAHCAGGPDYYASGNMFLYYEEGNPKRCVSPDVFFVRDRPRLPERRVYKTWEEEGRGPDLVIELTSRKTRKEDIARKYELYRDVLRVREYILFDPDGDYLEPSLQGHRLHGGEYRAIDLVEGRLTSEVVGLQFEPDGRQLNAYDPTTGRRVSAPRDAVREERDARLRAEAARLRAEAEIEQLRRELDAIRRNQGGTT